MPGIMSLFIEYDLMEYTFQHPEEKLRIVRLLAIIIDIHTHGISDS